MERDSLQKFSIVAIKAQFIAYDRIKIQQLKFLMKTTSDVRISESRPLIPPAVLAEEIPATQEQSDLVLSSRKVIQNILNGTDDRLLAIVGPCSVHDPQALLDYARQLKSGTAHLSNSIYPILRVYFEKPRTTVGWKGLINDPDLDESFHVNKGLRLARKVLVDVLDIGLPAATEFLDTTLGQYYAELVSYGAIGARTVESQIHRELASGLGMPVGFKNGTNGSTSVAVDAILSSREPHWFPSLTHEGAAAILRSTGNPYGHIILRGGNATGPNYMSPEVKDTASKLEKANLPPTVIIDCSHDNSGKVFKQQSHVIDNICDQLSTGESAIRGVMLESHLVEGRQSIGGGESLTYGQSITDGCLSLQNTLPLLEQLADAKS
jgi:3-deoxy-7-phosphoheptulonate synthase